MGTKMKFDFRPQTKVPCAYSTEPNYGSVVSITFSAQRKWHFLERKWKIKQKQKIHFRPKTKNRRKWPNSHIFGVENENEFRSAFGLMAWPEWPWPPQILRQIYVTSLWWRYDWLHRNTLFPHGQTVRALLRRSAWKMWPLVLQGHSRSSEPKRIDPPPMTFYLRSIATMGLPHTCAEMNEWMNECV